MEYPKDISLKEHFDFDPLLDAMEFRDWWAVWKNSILEKTKDQDACFIWLEEIERITWEQLENICKFQLMDKAIGQALEKIITKTQRPDLTLENKQ